MERKPVDSSDLKSVGYDIDSKTLEIEFHSRATYQYFGVPEGIHEGLMQAQSCGKYFHENIKSAYQCKKIS